MTTSFDEMLALVEQLSKESKLLRERRIELEKRDAEIQRQLALEEQKRQYSRELAKRLPNPSELRFRSKNDTEQVFDSIVKCRFSIIQNDHRYRQDSLFARALAHESDGQAFIDEIESIIEVATLDGGWMDFEPVWEHVFPFCHTDREDNAKYSKYRNRLYVIQLAPRDEGNDPWGWVYVGVTGNWPRRFHQHIDPENNPIAGTIRRKSTVTKHRFSTDINLGVRYDLCFRMTHIHDNQKLSLEKWLSDELEAIGFDVEGDRGRELKLS